MNWRWLIFDYVDPGLGLTRKQRREAWNRALMGADQHKLPPRSPLELLFAMVPAIIMAVVLLPIFLWQVSVWYIIPMLITQIILSWVLLALVGRWSHHKLIILALRHYGHNVCVRCGYYLKGLPDEAKNCPECGEKILETSSA